VTLNVRKKIVRALATDSRLERKLLKNPVCEKYIQYNEQFQDNSVFQGKRKLLKNRELWKFFQYSVY